MDEQQLTGIAQQVGERIDWKREELEGIAGPWEAGTPVEAVLAYVGYLRARPSPRLSHPPEYVHELRRLASAEQRQAARAKLGKALTLATAGAHTNPITAAGGDAFFLGVDAGMAEMIADRVLAVEDDWDKGPWGTTRSICELISRALLTPEFPDRCVVPLLGWLSRQVDAEWQWSRTWGADMLGDTGHNWWLHTYMGFFLAGLWFPQLKGLEQFRAFAPEYFEYEMQVLMETDGFTRERSGYHWGTVDHWLHVYLLGQANGVDWSPAFLAHLRLVGDTLWKTLAPNGDVPRVGDTGAAHAANTSLANVRTAAALLGLAEGKYVCEALAPAWTPPRSGLLAYDGRNLLPAYDRLVSRAPGGDPADTSLPVSGYYFMRQNWTPASDWLCVEAGPLGNTVTSHDHTHVFNIELYSRGRAILIDNCSGPYGDAPERLWRVGSASHNVATVDGEDHVRMDGEWRWKDRVVPMVNQWVSDSRFAYFSGAHEAYLRLPARVPSARRKVFYLRGGYWILIDRFVPDPAAEHTYEQHFHLAVPHELGADGRVATSGEGGNLLMISAGAPTCEARVEPCPYPLEKYDNPEHLTYTVRCAGPAVLATVLVPFEDERVPDVCVQALEVHADGRVLAPSEATGLEITIDGRRDVYVDQHMQWNLPWEAGGCRGSRRLFHSQCAAR